MKRRDVGARSRSCGSSRRRASLCIVVVLALCVVAGIDAQTTGSPAQPVVPSSGPGFTTLAAFTLPPSFYVGDRVELRIRLKLGDGVALHAPARMPDSKWIRIESIAVSHTSDYSVVHIYFASFAPGERSLPPIDLGGVTLEGIRITTASLVAEGNTRLSDPKGQLALPGTAFFLGLAVALLIGVPLVIVVVFRRFRTTIGDFLENQRARRPWRLLKRVLDGIAAQKPPLDPRSFYITLGDELRRYLTLKFGTDFRAVTAREFTNVARSVSVDENVAAGLAEVMSFGELVKFAGEPASEEMLRHDLARVRSIAEAIEETSERELRMRQRATSAGTQSDRGSVRAKNGNSTGERVQR